MHEIHVGVAHRTWRVRRSDRAQPHPVMNDAGMRWRTGSSFCWITGQPITCRDRHRGRVERIAAVTRTPQADFSCVSANLGREIHSNADERPVRFSGADRETQLEIPIPNTVFPQSDPLNRLKRKTTRSQHLFAHSRGGKQRSDQLDIRSSRHLTTDLKPKTGAFFAWADHEKEYTASSHYRARS
jgi:hypothetical protein